MLSEETVKSQVRYGELKANPPVPATLMELDMVKQFFSITDTTLDIQLQAASAAVTQAIRDYTGRFLTKGEYEEFFWDITDGKAERYLVETPIESWQPGIEVMNRTTGRTLLPSGQQITASYTGGYDPLPADLLVVFMTLVQQQMAVWGHETLGTAKPVNNPMEKSVTIGTLRVEYAVAATTPAARAASAGGITADALAPFANILDMYRSHRRLAAT